MARATLAGSAYKAAVAQLDRTVADIVTLTEIPAPPFVLAAAGVR